MVNFSHLIKDEYIYSILPEVCFQTKTFLFDQILVSLVMPVTVQDLFHLSLFFSVDDDWVGRETRIPSED